MPYCKAFGLYSLGCVLLEIGMWRSLLIMLLQWTSTTDKSSFCLPAQSQAPISVTRSQWHTAIAEKELFLGSIKNGSLGYELRSVMGERYANIVTKLLYTASATAESHAIVDENEVDVSDFSLKIQIEGLRTLRKMLDAGLILQSTIFTQSVKTRRRGGPVWLYPLRPSAQFETDEGCNRSMEGEVACRLMGKALFLSF